jgi:hypothetical protein
MKAVLGITLILIGVVTGLYIGLWWAFIGGIVQVINAIRAPEIVPLTIALGIAKIVLASFLGYISALIFIVPGWMLVSR